MDAETRLISWIGTDWATVGLPGGGSKLRQASVPGNLPAGKIWLIPVDNLFEATLAVGYQRLKGAGASPRVLSVLPSGDTWTAYDADKTPVDLQELEEPAIVFIPRDSVVHMQRDRRLWARVWGRCEPSDAS